MSPELKEKWIAALRSGKYEQGHETLHKGETFCCLGVLCDIAGYSWREYDAGELYSPKLYQCDAGIDYIENADIRHELGLPREVQFECYTMNDGNKSVSPHVAKHTFIEIADWLENQNF